MTKLSRRDLVKAASFGVTSTLCPVALFAEGQQKNTGKTLVLVELHGGNDGLNTIIPYTEKSYYEKRPTIHIPRKNQISVTNELAFNPELKPLLPMFERNQLSIVQGLGYENPNRSHFRSIEIWDTASGSDEFKTAGWLTQLGGDRHEKLMTEAVVFGRNAAPVLSPDSSIIVIDSIEKFYRQAKVIDKVSATSQHTALKHLLKTQNETKLVADELKRKLKARDLNLPEFSGGSFGKQLQEAAKLILVGGATDVIKVSLGGFDTHQNQRVDQGQLLKQLAEGLASFNQLMESMGLWDNVMVMTYSEFGRRVAENGSGGTDHGTAAPHFVMGGQVRGGLYGAQPSLDDLDNGDLKYSTDFKDYYQTILSNWLGSTKHLSETSVPFLKELTS